MKANDKQIAIINYLQTQLSYWRDTNDIDSPTHGGDINEETINIDCELSDDEESVLEEETYNILKYIRTLQ